MIKHNLLKPACQAMAQAAAEKLTKAGIKFCDTSGFRSEAEQVALFAQGRRSLEVVNNLRKLAGMYPLAKADNTYKVTNCDGIKNKSRHQSGLAIDRVPANDQGQPLWPPESDPRWRQIADVMIEVGFRWGGDWNGDGKTRYEGDKTETMIDLSHFELVEGE